jgi:hypothetical protein
VLKFLGKAGGYVFQPGRIEEIIKRAAEPSLNGPAAFLFFYQGGSDRRLPVVMTRERSGPPVAI